MRPIPPPRAEPQQSRRENRVSEDPEAIGAQGSGSERQQHGLQLQRVCGFLDGVFAKGGVPVAVSGLNELGVQREGERGG
ncbi:unnamed protein product [Linum tenue]|uniref:Uncharacterized protein n=1 Tax=Linum tenue TaxID=586396 RepID=A0AAV0L8P1_9ROSI|nr:unnamed protein product [Linum tenue]